VAVKSAKDGVLAAKVFKKLTSESFRRGSKSRLNGAVPASVTKFRSAAPCPHPDVSSGSFASILAGPLHVCSPGNLGHQHDPHLCRSEYISNGSKESPVFAGVLLMPDGHHGRSPFDNLRVTVENLRG
jgi:hypothetical protein